LLDVLTSDKIDRASFEHFRVMTAYFPVVKTKLDEMIGGCDHQPDLQVEFLVAALIEILCPLVQSQKA
jgi:hypothetical protein